MINIYIEAKREGSETRYGYILEAIVKDTPVTRSGRGTVKGTLQKGILTAAVEALARMTRQSRITISVPEGSGLIETLCRLDELAKDKFYEHCRKVNHHKELETIYASGHEIEFKEGESPYRNWIIRNLLEEA
jgi:hypothetical protein